MAIPKQSQKISKLIIVLLIALIPFLSTNLTYDPTIIKTTLIKLGIIILFSLYLMDSLKNKKIEIRKTGPMFFLILLGGYITLNFILKYPLSSTEEFFTIVLFFAFFFVLVHLSFTPLFLQIIAWQFFAITSLIGLASIIHYFTHFQRVSLFFYNPNFLASYFVFSIPISLCLLHERYKNYLAEGHLKRIDLLLYLLFLIQIGGLISTVSRAGCAGFSAAILFLVLLRSPKNIWKRGSALALIIMFSTFIFMMSMTQVFADLLGSRAAIWQGTKQAIKENLLTGCGIGSFSKVYPSFRIPEYFTFIRNAPMTLHSHNEFLETCAELGIIGALLNLCFIISVFIFVLQRMNKTEDRFKHVLICGLVSGIAGLFMQNFFSVSLRIPFITFYLWLGLGICTGLTSDKNIGRAVNLKNSARRQIPLVIFIALAIWPSIRFILFPFLGDFYFRKGYYERVNKNLSQAVSYYTRALRFSPMRPDIYYTRAFISNKTGREKEALQDYLKIEKISPGYAKVYLNLGITYMSLGELQKATDNLKKAIAANPYDSHAHNSLGVAYSKNGYFKKAKKEFERALCIDPGLKDAQFNLIKLCND